MAELQTNVKQGAVIGGWVCFGVGILFMVHSLWAFIFYVPLFLAAFVLSIVAMAQRRVGGGLALLLCCVIIPPIAFVYCLGLMAQRLQASDSLKSPSPSPWLETATPAQAQSKFTSEATSTPSPAELATTSSTPVEVAPQTFPESTFTATPNALDASLATATPAPSTYRVIGVSRGDYLMSAKVPDRIIRSSRRSSPTRAGLSSAPSASPTVKQLGRRYLFVGTAAG
jgi:hypothetical protein